MEMPWHAHRLLPLYDPDVLSDYGGDRDAWIVGMVGSLKENEKRIIEEYLDHLLGGKLSDVELRNIWSSLAPRYNFSLGGHRWLLGLIRDEIERSLRASQR